MESTEKTQIEKKESEKKEPEKMEKVPQKNNKPENSIMPESKKVPDTANGKKTEKPTMTDSIKASNTTDVKKIETFVTKNNKTKNNEADSVNSKNAGSANNKPKSQIVNNTEKIKISKPVFDKRGYLLIIGGAEDKRGESVVLKHARNMVFHDEILTVLTTATEEPQEAGRNYEDIFSRLGVKDIQIIDISTREQANDKQICSLLKQSKCVFFTGGDQLRITSILGGTLAYDIIKEIYSGGGAIMGTSAGASVMSSTMIVEGNDNEPARKCTTKMAPGLGFLDNVIIDQHFDQRGRFGRLLTSVAENPGSLGIGIDEDTAIKVYPDMTFEVLGNNSVTIIDGKSLKSSNVSELDQEELLAVIGVTVHAIPYEYGFNLINREVIKLGYSH